MERDPPSPARATWLACMLFAAFLTAPLPAFGQSLATPAAASARDPDKTGLPAEIGARASGDLRAFYRARANRPLWVTPAGGLTLAASDLLGLVRSARVDGIDFARLRSDSLAAALDRARLQPGASNLARAELALSSTLAAYVQAMRRVDRAAMTYEARDLAPAVPTTSEALTAAAAAPSLERYLADMGWMHPLYAPLRKAAAIAHDPAEAARLQANLARVRALPADPAQRYILVDAAGARLWMYENGHPVDTMKVVVGKVDNQTPMLAGYVRYAILNPYWNVPVDLARTKIAPKVLEEGLRYLKRDGYQVMSDWTDAATVVDPATIDWHAVADGTLDLRVRQLPGTNNFMGRVKFEFPNQFGIYLHDTPEMDLMAKSSRHYSSGCVRLEDAQRLGRWLMHKPLPRHVSEVEDRIDLPEQIPVYITYLTAVPVNGQIVVQPDSYGRDRPSLAGGGDNSRSR